MPTPIPRFRVQEKSTFVDGRRVLYFVLSSPHARDENIDNVRLSFQGGLVKAQSKFGKTVPSAAPDDSVWFKKSLDLVWMLKARDLPDDQVCRVNGRVVGLNVSQQFYKSLEWEAQQRALENKKSWSSARRGTITHFSRKSRKRLIELACRLRDDARGLFITCTYRTNQRDFRLSKSHLDKLCRWLRYHYPWCSILWRMETQDRGAIHYHLLVFGVRFIPAKMLTAYWQSLTGDDSYPDVKRIHNRRQALSYVSKYIAKRLDQVGRRFIRLIPREARMDLSICHKRRRGFFRWKATKELRLGSGFIGRFWGVAGRNNLPMADEAHYQEKTAVSPYLQFRRAVGKVYPPARRGRITGFSLFTKELEVWKRYWLYCIDQFAAADSSNYIYKQYQVDGAWRNISPGYKKILDRSTEIVKNEYTK